MACEKGRHESRLISKLVPGDILCLQGGRKAKIREVQNVNDLLRIKYSEPNSKGKKGRIFTWIATEDATVLVELM